ncbi:hypothetical protein [unidentified bacterial endosymbiont]|jgi:hypothetical protein|uniref:hypothetical protein n=1 Tax=unidentified bacterial endosymbiont TaxID=2355 RepID=UPI00209CE86E|nr:hypothetical protein [unidentified bacterial endosymbiont]
MLHQLLYIKQRKERTIRNSISRVVRLQKQVEQEIIKLRQLQTETQKAWQLACSQFAGKVERLSLMKWQEDMRSYQTKYENIGLQVAKMAQQREILIEKENELQGMLKEVLIAQEKINYIIATEDSP